MAFDNPHMEEPGPCIEAASRSSRLKARLIDYAVAIAPMVFLFLPAIGPLVIPFVIIGLMIWQVHLLVTLGQTIGKRAMGIYIMRSDGSIPNFGWIVLREFAIPLAVGFLRYAGRRDPSPLGQAIQVLLGFVWLIDILMIFGGTRRCLHDLVAGTHVVKA